MNKKGKLGRKIRPIGESSRVLILEAFLKLCHEQGPGGITLQMLADRTDMTLANIRYTFAAKNIDLYHAALEHLLEKAYLMIESHLSAERSKADFDPVRTYIDVMFRWIEENPVNSSFLYYFYYLCTTHVKKPVTNATFLQVARTRIQGLIHEGIGKGLYAITQPVPEVALQVHALVMGTCTIAATQFSDPQVTKDQKRICLELVQNTILHTCVN